VASGKASLTALGSGKPQRNVLNHSYAAPPDF
jgi:hypothetical protein